MPASPGRREELVALTTMRGIAASLVLVYHMRPETSTSWVAQGYLWVDFFFILSGFILAYVYGDPFAQRVSGPRYRDLLAKRLARVYPLHLVTLLIAIALARGAHLHHFDSPTHSIFTNLLLVHAWGFEHRLTWNVVSWSISAEWGFYLVFPLMVPVYFRAGRAASLAGIAVALVALGLLERHFGSLNLAFDFALVRCLLETSIGIFLYNLYRDRSAAPLHRFARLDILRWPLLVLPFAMMQLHCDTAVVVSFTLMFLPLALATGSLERLMSWPPLAHVGRVSYSLYMIHWIVIYFALKALKPFGLDTRNFALALPASLAVHAAVLALCIACATVLYRTVEGPTHRFSRERARRREAALVS